MKDLTNKTKYFDVAVTDFDGTLARTDCSISQNTLKVINNFINNGGTFIVCTGRMSSSIIKICRNYGFKGYVIAYNGGEICDIESGKKIFFSHVDNQTCVKVAKFASQNDYYLQAYCNDVLTVDYVNENYKKYSSVCGVELLETYNLSEYFVKTGYTSGKLLFYVKNNQVDLMINQIKQVVGQEYSVIHSNTKHIDIMKKGISKGNTLIKLLSILGKSIDKTVCFGDETNDLSMLEIAGLSVLTENGNDCLKEKVDIVTTSNDNEGVANVIEKYCI